MRSSPVARNGLPSNRITSATTTQVSASRSATLHRVFVEVATAGITTFNDSTGTKLIWPAAIPVGSYELNMLFSGKLEVVTAGADRLVVVYEPAT